MVRAHAPRCPSVQAMATHLLTWSGKTIQSGIPIDCNGNAVCIAMLLDLQRRRGYRKHMDYKHLITIEPDKRSGQPCIRGLRMTVQDVLDYLASGMSVDEILADFPDLTAEDIRACLAFAADRERRLRVVPPA